MKEITDDSMLVERYGKVPVCLVEGAYENLENHHTGGYSGG